MTVTDGLTVWLAYILDDEDRLGWIAVAILAGAAVLGLIMAARWIGVYRTYAGPGSRPAGHPAVPPERNFPVPVVMIHGLLGLTTIVLVLWTAPANPARWRA